MAREVGAMALSEFTSELSSLMLRRQSVGGLTKAEETRFHEMNLALRPHAGPAGSPEERRQFLRLPISGTVELYSGAGYGKLERACCREIGIGGVFAEMTPSLQVGEGVRLGKLEVSGLILPLDVRAEVVRCEGAVLAEGGFSEPIVGLALRYFDLDVAGLRRVKNAFDALFERAARTPGVACTSVGRAPAIPDVDVLTRVCCGLLRVADIVPEWSPEGPSQRLRMLLSANGRPLPIAKRVLLLFAWRLWLGDCDLRSTEFWHLTPAGQETAQALLEAVKLGSSGTAAWLARYGSQDKSEGKPS